MSHYSAQTIQHKLENDYGTPVQSVEASERDGEWKVTVEISGGFSFAFNATDRLRLKHLVGNGKGESFKMYVVEKR